MRDLAGRIISERVQISIDGLGAYNEPIQRYFFHRADHGSEVKDNGVLDGGTPERKYRPMVVKQVVRTPVWGVPDAGHVSTAYVERKNLTMPASMRRFNPADQRLLEEGGEPPAGACDQLHALQFLPQAYDDQDDPANKAGLTDHLWTLHDLTNLPDLLADGVAV